MHVTIGCDVRVAMHRKEGERGGGLGVSLQEKCNISHTWHSVGLGPRRESTCLDAAWLKLNQRIQ